MKRSWVVMGCLLLSAVAEARGGSGILFDVNAYYSSSKSEGKQTGGTNDVKSDSSVAIYDLKLGYLTESGLYVGGLYTSRSNNVLDQSGTNGSATGVSLGYMGAAGIFLQGHYLTNASYGTLSEGTGLQADVGYKAGMGSGWLLGGELSYRSISYKKQSDNAGLDTYKITEVIPMISIGYLF